MWKWMYKKGSNSFESMDDLPKSIRTSLSENFTIHRGNIVDSTKSKSDQTVKFLIELEDKKQIEAVYIKHDQWGTLCVSSQVGCSLNCRFCKTGTQPISRNLTSGEIVSQLLIAQAEFNDFRQENKKPKINNIVFMGQGEPLYNYKNIKDAIQIMTSEEGCEISKRKITLSTSGVIPVMKKAIKDLGVNLAVSLHATTNEMRDYLVPLNKIFPIELLMDTIRAMAEDDLRHVTFEYVMLNNVNDSIQDAERLVALLKNLQCSVNLIAFNEWDGSGFTCTPVKKIQEFSQYLYNNNINAPVRYSHGSDIDAACGQLKTSFEQKKQFIERTTS
ncbi:hypothetical protein AKO1_006646 [Acrasis kona]|uniref:Radical SAM core domain-containing protein n=1 Tax=Acrasis kona TaxID=1008807 RepID=A0AAW2ZK07_9EUKA